MLVLCIGTGTQRPRYKYHKGEEEAKNYCYALCTFYGHQTRLLSYLETFICFKYVFPPLFREEIPLNGYNDIHQNGRIVKQEHK